MVVRACFCFLAFFTLAACGDTNVAETQECNAGDKRCTTDGSVEICNDTGQFMFSEQCAIDKQCSAGECVDPPPPEACTTDVECTTNGSNACLVPLCDNGTCKETIRDEPGCCDPDLDVPCGGMGDPCTTDSCVDFNCILTPVENCCTEETDCIAKDCQTFIECDANNTCIYDSNCCAADDDCTDNNACTTNTCVDQDCVNTAVDGCCINDSECDDNNACTTNTCLDGSCNTQVKDSEGCCLAAEDCSSPDPCTGFACSNNECIPNSIANCCDFGNFGKAKCDDAKECTLDTCNPDNTCSNPNKPNATPCSGSKQCNNGKCEVPKAPDPKDPSSPSS
jgi:hypothetical protein